MCAETYIYVNVSSHELCVQREVLSAVMNCVCRERCDVSSHELCVQREVLMSTVMNRVCRNIYVNVNSHELCVQREV